MSQFIVTGGAGFIGSHLVDALVGEGHKVTVLDDLSTGKRENVNPKANLHVGDIRDEGVLRTLFTPEISGCFHLAAIASVERSNKEWMETHTINSAGAVNVFEASARVSIPVVYASSAAIYGPCENLPIKESEPADPLTAYGVDKYSNELHGAVADHIHGIPTIGFRFFNVFGPRQDPASPYSGVISIFIKQALEGKPFTLNGDGTQTRDFIYVKDIVRSLIAGMTQKLQTPKGADIYNICTGTPTSLLELTQCLEEITGKSLNKIHGEPRAGDIQKSLGDPTKLREILGIQAETPFKSGLQTTVDSIATTKEKLSHAS